MRPQSMSAIVAPLQQSGLVRGAPDPSDGRQTLMSLTPKCLKWLQQGRAARQDWLTTTISQKLSVHEQEKLQSALDLLVAPGRRLTPPPLHLPTSNLYRAKEPYAPDHA